MRITRPKIFYILVPIVAIPILLFIINTPRKVYSANQGKTSKAVSIVVDRTRVADVPVYLTSPGTVTSKDTITVQTQISGKLERVFFREGQPVKKGEVIAHIDSRPYEAQVLEYEGQYERDKALLENARLDLKRYQLLYPEGAVSKQVYDTQVSLVKQEKGVVKLDLGLLQNAQINLDYCDIVSPVTGRIGLRLVDEGNFVQPTSTTGIAVINVTNPIDIVFTIPEDSLPDVLDKLEAGNSLEAFIYDRSQTHLLATGKLLTNDNQINQATGTVNLKAEFNNPKNLLFPNQFVNAKLLVETLKNALVTPTASVQHNSNGAYVYLLNSNNTVHVQVVTTGITDGDNTVIVSGLTSDQEVVVEGIDKLFDGAAVTTGKKK